MRIEVVALMEADGETLVKFESGIGVGAGQWKSSMLPVVGQSYDVEFDVDDLIDFARTASSGRESYFHISESGGWVVISGYVESQDDDGMTYFRLAQDCLIMIESEEADVLVGKWLTLRFGLGDFALCPQGS